LFGVPRFLLVEKSNDRFSSPIIVVEYEYSLFLLARAEITLNT